jgi:hypothetical protein
MLNTRKNEIFNANDVINSNDLRKRIVNVDSRFRTNMATDTTTNFQYKFDQPYKNVIRARIASIEIPNVWYEFSGKNYHNTSFSISAYDISNNLRTVNILIGDGNYTAIDLLTAIQSEFDTLLKQRYGIFMSIYPDTFSLKTTILHTGVGPIGSTTPTATAKPFLINFRIPETADQPCNWGLGYNMGYRNRYYTVNNIYDVSGAITQYYVESESLIDVTADPYIFLAVNDYHSVEQQNTSGYSQALAKIIVREDKNNVIYDDGGTLLSNDIIFPSPIDLKVIQVKVVDPYGQVLDLNDINFSFSMEITEVTNTKLYEFYRNYIWLGTIPSLPSNVTGSGQGLLGGRGP